jgi:hypothetical protein
MGRYEGIDQKAELIEVRELKRNMRDWRSL